MKLIRRICDAVAIIAMIVWSLTTVIFVNSFISEINKTTMMLLGIIWFTSLSYLIIWGTSE